MHKTETLVKFAVQRHRLSKRLRTNHRTIKCLPSSTHTHTHSLRFLLGLQAPREGAKLGTFKAWSVGSVVRPRQEREAQLPSSPSAPTLLWSGVHVRKLPVGHPEDSPPPSFLPQRVNLRSSWVSGESGNKGKESHFLSRGRKEAEIQPASHPAGFKLNPRAGTDRAEWEGLQGLAVVTPAIVPCPITSNPFPKLCNSPSALFFDTL